MKKNLALLVLALMGNQLTIFASSSAEPPQNTPLPAKPVLQATSTTIKTDKEGNKENTLNQTERPYELIAAENKILKDENQMLKDQHLYLMDKISTLTDDMDAYFGDLMSTAQEIIDPTNKSEDL